MTMESKCYTPELSEPFANHVNSGVYKIENLINGKLYIGSSTVLKQRIQKHKRMLKTNKHHSQKLQASYNKYGEENFSFSIIEYCFNTIEREQYWMDQLRPYDKGVGYNIRTVAHLNTGCGKKWTMERRVKFSEECKKRCDNLGFKEFMSRVHSGKAVSQETRKKSSISHLGNKMSTEAKLKLSARNKGRVVSKEVGKKISLSKKGIRTNVINFTEKVRSKISESKRKKVIQLSVNGSLIRVYNSIRDASNDVGISMSLISRCLRNSKYTAKGYKWAFYEN